VAGQGREPGISPAIGKSEKCEREHIMGWNGCCVFCGTPREGVVKCRHGYPAGLNGGCTEKCLIPDRITPGPSRVRQLNTRLDAKHPVVTTADYYTKRIAQILTAVVVGGAGIWLSLHIH
jgi:hypothetical protein